MQQPRSPLLGLIIRGALGGVLMGAANLVPGISGGTMLLAAGVYPLFIAAVAEVTTLKLNTRSLALLAAVVGAAVPTILLGAGFIKDAVVHQRWIAYSLFIGLTLGGAPLVWKLGAPRGKSFWMGAVAGLAVMAVMALGAAGDGGFASNYAMSFTAGAAGAASMILPGVSGGYLLLVLGQYEVVLGAVDKVKLGLLGDSGSGMDPGLILEAMHVVIPVGLGVVIGVVGVSNLLKWLLARHKVGTLGVLFGLLLGAVIGLWPFQESRPAQPGESIKGVLVTVDNRDSFDAEDLPLQTFKPTAGQAGAGVLLILLGFGVTIAVDRLGERLSDGSEDEGTAF